MPTEQENVQYLYLVLTHGGTPTIDWGAVGAAMDLKKGAVSKRWSRLKQSMEKGETPAGSVYAFLWLCLKHSTRDKTMNWQEIADACNTTSGAASKRYSRMKQAFEAGETAPGSQSGTPAPNTPKTPKTSKSGKKKPVWTQDDNDKSTNATPTPTPKRKRAAPKNSAAAEDTVNIKNEPEDENIDMEEQSPKKSKVAKSKKAADIPVPTTEATAIVKGEVEVDDADTFVDAKEWVKELTGDDEDSMSERVNDSLQERN
ncbi:hypothetical protein BKA63DRAFT_569736 [Paraphoma chrysanthemicola]|nr:hypothetical protein BKA63DRAFT_569736 [Paraphoma chrysanthemicola]